MLYILLIMIVLALTFPDIVKYMLKSALFIGIGVITLCILTVGLASIL